MKELIKTIYLKNIKCKYFWSTIGIKQTANTVLFISTFTDNNTSIKKYLSPNIYNILEFDPTDTPMTRQLKMIKSADVIIIDNYYYPLAVLNLKGKKVVQIWHANGAVKKFGLASPKNQKVKKSAKKRFKAVYNAFDYITVGSDEMKKCMQSAFEITDERKFLTTGFTRSDYLYNNQYEDALKQIIVHNQHLSNKYIILYMPTFRDDKIANKKQLEFVKKLAQELPEEFCVFYRLHPSINSQKYKIPGAVEVNDFELNGFYKLSNLIITDYSSIIFDAAVFHTPCAFYTYDYQEYLENQGLFIEADEMPGFVTDNADQMIEYVKKQNYDISKIKDFDQRWNQYNSANSGRNLVIELFYKGEK